MITDTANHTILHSNHTAIGSTYELLEPFLLKPMTDEAFQEFLLMDNHEISIENIDFSKAVLVA